MEDSYLKDQFNFLETMRQVDLMRSYISITAEQGPSAQLINFIDYDGKFGKEFGLESFDESSVEIKHELLLSVLNPDSLESLGLESLADKIIKASKIAFFSGGIGALAVSVVNPALAIVPLGIAVASIFTQQVGYKLSSRELYTKYEVERSIEILRDQLKINIFLQSNAPSTFDEKSWMAFKAKLEGENSELVKLRKNQQATFDRHDKHDRKEILSRSGWTPQDFTRLNGEYIEVCKKLREVQNAHRVKVERFNQFLSKEHTVSADVRKTVYPIVYEYVNQIKNEYRSTNQKLLGISSIVANVRSYLQKASETDT